MRRVAITLALCLLTSSTVSAGDFAAEKETLSKALNYLKTAGAGWRTERKCGSCHHAPQMIWAFREAKQKQIPVDDAMLEEFSAWVFDPKGDAKVLPIPKKTGEEGRTVFPFANVLTTLALQAGGSPSVRAPENFQAVTEALVKEQQPDGSWEPIGGRPPLFDGREVITLWGVLFLTPSDPKYQVSEAGQAARKRALDWLAANGDREHLQALALRLILAVRQSAAKDVTAPSWRH